MANLFARFSRKAIISFLLLMLLGLGVFFYFYARGHSVQVAVQSLEVFGSIAKILPIPADTKKEIEVITQLTEALTAQDDEERKYLILLQNNMELRPGGGFLGQYAVLTIKNGQVVSHFFEDANLLDQRIITPVAPPSPLRTMLSLKKWKFRDSNFSPDFPTNVEKAKYFYRLAGKNSNFDGVIAVNADVLTHVLLLTGPITAYGRTFTADNVVLDLEEVVEKPYLGEDVPAELKQNRKAIMKTMTEIIIERLSSLNNVPKIANLILEELRNKDIMISFEDASLQTAVESVHWDGRVASGWEGDYLMIVDANLGALKTDYYIKRRYEYTVDFTGGTDINTQDKNYRTVVTQQADQSQQTQEDVEGVKRPRVTLRVHYDHTAPQGNWRTSDYHTWTRVYVPKGSTMNSWLLTGTPQKTEEFSKTVFGYKVDALIGRELVTTTVYDLPETITSENYHLLVQKQSGVGTVPFTARVITGEKTVEHTADLSKDLKFELSS